LKPPYTAVVLRLSVVVPATNRPATLTRVVHAIEASVPPPDDLIVVDEPQGLGPAAARNLGARRAQGDVILFVDADVEVHPDALTRIRAAFNDDEHLDAVFGSYDAEPEHPGLVSVFRNLLHHHTHTMGAGPASTFWAGLGAVRRDVFFEAGGFDEKRFRHPSVEDIELGMRLYDRGARIVLDPAIQGKHLKAWTLGQMTATDLRRRGIPWVRLLLERETASTALNLGWRNRLGTLGSLALVWSLLRRHGRVTSGAAVFLLLLDRRFYLILFRRNGAKQAAAGMSLHVLHRIISVASVPPAVIAHFAAKRSKR
jgi:GT2 family glycosyltransferase